MALNPEVDRVVKYVLGHCALEISVSVALGEGYVFCVLAILRHLISPSVLV